MNIINKKWFITGCGSGFGHELAKQLLSDGHLVAVTTRDKNKVRNLAENKNALVLELDVSKPEQVRSVIDQAWNFMGGIDVLVNNAGYGIQGSVEDTPDNQVRDLFETNFFGLLDVTRAIIPKMRTQGHGHIINISSIGGRDSAPLMGLYSASKFAVEGLSVCLAEELEPFGIKVTVVEPGVFNSNYEKKAMIHVQHSTAYLPMVKAMEDRFSNLIPDDPSDAARVLAQIAELADSPYQFPLGLMAYETVEKVLSRQKEELERWSEFSISASSKLL